MQKLVKKKYIKLKTKKFKNRPVKFYRKNLLKNKCYSRLRFLKIYFFNKLKQRFFFNIVVKPNNVFCSFKTSKKGQFSFSSSSGKYQIKITKKRLRFSIVPVVIKFIKEIKLKLKRKLFKSQIIVVLNSPIRIRKVIIDLIRDFFTKNDLIFKIVYKKVFNGCRAPKKIRKKKNYTKLLK